MTLSRAIALLMVCLAGASLATADITIEVIPSSAPNAYGSPSWSAYMANALYSLENGLGNLGDRNTDPTAYEIAPAQILPGEIAVTSFKSWRGQVAPPAPFLNELGNRLHFGLHAYGDGQAQFRLEDLTFELHSSDPWDSLAYTGDFIGYGYTGTSRIGIDWGPDRVKGGGDDIVYTSGNGMTLVDEIVYVGIGNAWWPSSTPDPQTGMDEYVAFIEEYDPIAVCCTYAIQGFSGASCVDVATTPDPPLCSTFEAKDIQETSAKLYGDVIEDGGLPCEYRFVYWPDGGSAVATEWTGYLTDATAHDVAGFLATGLTPGTVYHYRIDVRNGAGEDDGNVRDFVTTARLAISSGPHGSVVKPGEGVFLGTRGKSIDIEAQAGPGYVFGGWTGSAVDAGLVKKPAEAATSVKYDGDQTLVANFKAKIIWVSDAHMTSADPNDPNLARSDAGWTDLLTAAGYVVDNQGPEDVNVNGTMVTRPYWFNLDDAKLAALDEAALVIISRDCSSGDVNNKIQVNANDPNDPNAVVDVQERTLWSSVQSPMMLMNVYIARANRWQWVNTNALGERQDYNFIAPVDATHPLFAGVTLDPNTNDVQWIDPCVASGFQSFLNGADALGSGQALAVRPDNGMPQIAVWQAGTPFYATSDQTPADTRMLFSAGCQEKAGEKINWGNMNMTAEGQQMFLNAVAYLLTAQDTVALVNPSFEDPNTGKIKGWNGTADPNDPSIVINDIPGWASDGDAVDSGVETGWGATDGVWSGFIMNGDPFVYQLTGYTIQADDVAFCLTVDAKNNWAATKFMMIIYYDEMGLALPVATQEVDLTDAMQTFTLTFEADTALDCVGKRIGIEFANSTPVAGGSWMGFDRISLSVLSAE